MAEIIVPPNDEQFNSMAQAKAANVSVSEIATPAQVSSLELQQMTPSAAALSKGKPFTVSVNWPADGQWHTVTPDFANQTGITSYIIYDQAIPIIGTIQVIGFTTNKTYDYTFTDGDSASYKQTPSTINTLQTVSLLKQKPSNVVFVTGT